MWTVKLNNHLMGRTFWVVAKSEETMRMLGERAAKGS